MDNYKVSKVFEIAVMEIRSDIMLWLLAHFSLN